VLQIGKAKDFSAPYVASVVEAKEFDSVRAQIKISGHLEIIIIIIIGSTVLSGPWPPSKASNSLLSS
jgi:hypothetical protein